MQQSNGLVPNFTFGSIVKADPYIEEDVTESIDYYVIEREIMFQMSYIKENSESNRVL